MGVPTGTFQTYQAIGNREDLIDVITNIDPVDTWFTSNSGTARATNRYHEWQTDALAAAAANIVIEGDDAANVAVVPTVRTGNYCQILRKVFQVSDTQEAVNKAGRDSELSYQTQKVMRELARDIEYALVINSASASGASATARQSLGVNGWITTNVTTGTGTGNEALTETMINDNLQLIWAAGGKPQTMLMGGAQKRALSGLYTTSRISNIAADEKSIVSAVDVFVSNFGTLQARIHQQMHATLPSVIIVIGDMSLWNKGWLRPIKMETLARTGAATKRMIEAELTLESRQEKGSGKITQLS